MSLETREQQKLSTDIEATQPRRPARPKRQKGSVVERTAFWSSLVCTILFAGIAITVKALAGITSTQLIILGCGGVVSTLLLVPKNRWTTLLATLLNGYLFYLVWTEPFVTESISYPKGPDGGLGHFEGVVMVITASILTVLCCAGATIQHFQGENRKTPRWYPVVVGLVIGMTLGAWHVGGASLPPSAINGLATANGVTILHVEATGFLQTSVTVAKGSKITFVNDTTEKHDFFNGVWLHGAPQVQQEAGAPLVKDLTLTGSDVTIGPFNTAGTFHIFCTLHRGMQLTVIVQ